MNSYNIQFGPTIENSDFISAVMIGMAMSKNFDVVPTGTNVAFNFDLPFSLSNFNIEAIGYDTRYQNVMESLDKPYITAGRLIGILYLAENDGYDIKQDYDEFLRYKVGTGRNDDDEVKPLMLYIGVANGTLTESYQPFGISKQSKGDSIVSYKIFDPSDIAKAMVKSSCSTNSPARVAGNVAREILNSETTRNTRPRINPNANFPL